MVRSRTSVFSFAARQGLLLLPLSASLLLSGCGVTPVTETTVSTDSVPGQPFNGVLHGGQNPISGATVKLWYVGKTGYGSTATQLGSTQTTGADGSFSFGTYSCPSSSTTPLTYITATGGDPGLGTGSNSAIQLMAVLAGPGISSTPNSYGPVSYDVCGTVASSKPYVTINEVSTVVAINTLAQFFNPSTEAFGAPLTNVYGIDNAFNTAGSIMAISQGAANASYFPYSYFPYTTSSTPVVNQDITATPEVQKINLIANILAACVNSAGPTSTACTSLATDAVPPPAGSTTTLGSTFTFPTLVTGTPGTGQVAVDTLRAAYYLAVNPINASTPGVPDNTKMADLYGKEVAGAPFVSTAAQPTDWTLAVTYGSTNTSATGAYLISKPTSLNIDAIGNVYFVSTGGTGTSTNVATILTAYGGLGSYKYDGTFPYTGLTLDAGTMSGTVSQVGVQTVSDSLYFSETTSGTKYMYGAQLATNYLAGTNQAIAKDATSAAVVQGLTFADDDTSLFFTGANGFVYETPDTRSGTFSGNITLTAVNSAALSGITTATSMAVDATKNAWVTGPGSNAVYKLAYPATPVTSGTQVSPTTYTTGLSEPTGIAIDHSNNAWVINNGGTPASGYVAEISSTGTITADTTSGDGGINTPGGIALDGAGNVWVASTGTGTSFTGQTVSELALVGGTLTPLSPSVGFSHTYSGPNSLAIDGAGNVWVANSGLAATSSIPGTLTELLGSATPTATSFATAIKNGKLAATP